MSNALTDYEKLGFDLVECSTCGEYAYRKPIGISPNKRRKYYQDERGKAWRGKQCPTCSTKAHTAYMKKHRSTKN
jgi:ribosomal protein S27AE